MANQDDELYFKIEIDEAESRKYVEELTEDVIVFRKKLEELKKQFKEGAITQAEFAAKTADLDRKAKLATKAIADENKALQNHGAVTEAAIGSVDQLKGLLPLLVAQYNALSKEQRENTEAGRALTKQINQVNSELKNAGDAIGDNRREVGSYRKAIQEAIGSQVPFIANISSVSGVLKDAKKYYGDNKQGLIESVKGFNLAGIASINFGKAIKTALAATGIGLIIIAITSLIALFTRSQAGIDLLARKMAAFGAVVNVITSYLVKMGEYLVKVFEGGFLNGIKQLGDAILDNVIVRLKAVFTLLEGLVTFDWNKIKNGALDAATGIQDTAGKAGKLKDELAAAAAAGEAVAKESQRIREEGLKITAQYKKMRGESERLQKIADDTNQSYATRLGALNKATALEEKIQTMRVRQQKAIIANAKAEAKINGNNYEDRLKIAEAEAELGDIQEDRYERQATIQSSLQSITKEQQEKQKELSKEAAQAEIDSMERTYKFAAKIGKDTLSMQEAIIRKKAELEKKDAKTAAQRRSIDEAAQAEIIEARTARVLAEQQRYFRVQEAGINARLSAVKAGTKEEAELLNEQIRNRAQQERLSAVTTITDAKERAAKLREIDASELAQKKAVAQNFKAFQLQNDATAIQARINLVQEGSDTELQIRKELLDAQLKLELENVNLTESQKAEIKSRYAKEQAKIDQARRDLQLEKELTMAQSSLNATRAGSRKEYLAKLDYLNKAEASEIQKAGLTEAAKDEIRTRYQRERENLDRDYFERMIDFTAQAVARSVSITSTLLQASSEAAMNSLDMMEKNAVKSAGTNAELKTRIEEKYQKKREKLEKEAAKKRQKIASIENIINTAAGVTKALAQGGIFGFVTAALIAAEGYAKQAVIDTQKFADGGVAGYRSDGKGAYLGSGPGTSKSDSIPARLSKGESILTAKATAENYNTLSAMNVKGGGRPFPGAEGGSIPGFAYGGVVDSTNYGALTNALVSAISTLNVQVSVQEIASKNATMVQVKERSKY